MATYNVTWVYFGNVSAMNGSPTWRNASQGEVNQSGIVGQTYDGIDDLDPINVSGDNVVTSNPTSPYFRTTYSAGWMSPASEMSYTPTGGSPVSGVKISAFLDTKFEIVIDDGEGGQETVTRDGVIIQMTNGDLFMRPSLDTQQAWAGIGEGADSSIVSIKVVSAKPFSNSTVPATISYNPVTGETTIICFVAGTLIATPEGPRPAEELAAGDMVLTRDHGQQVLRWAGATRIGARRLDLAPGLRPIRIRAGALGAGLPLRDLVVSPQHRILVSSKIAQRMFGAEEVLVAAKHLLGIDGIEVARDLEEVCYVHLLLDQHEILEAEGAAAESLYLGPQTRKAVGDAAWREIRSLFPELVEDELGQSRARPFVSGRQGRSLSRRQQKHAQPLARAS